jgi:hypothetical protein
MSQEEIKKGNWMVMVLDGSIYENQTNIANFLNGVPVNGQVTKDAASVKIATETYQGKTYTHVISIV